MKNKAKELLDVLSKLGPGYDGTLLIQPPMGRREKIPISLASVNIDRNANDLEASFVTGIGDVRMRTSPIKLVKSSTVIRFYRDLGRYPVAKLLLDERQGTVTNLWDSPVLLISSGEEIWFSESPESAQIEESLLD